MTTYSQTSESPLPTKAATGGSAPWLAAFGLALLACAIVSGVAQATDDFRWWSLFVVIPTALITATGVVMMFRRSGIAGYGVANIGLVAFAVGVMLMFAEVSRYWPLTIMLPAAGIAGSYYWRPDDRLARSFHRTIALLAAAAIALGGAFLAARLDQFDPNASRWWAWFMIAAGLIVVGNGAELVRHRLAYRVSAAALAAGPGIVTILIGIRFLRDWPF